MRRKEPVAVTVEVRLAEPEDFEAVTRLLEELGRPQVGSAEENGAREVYLRHLRRDDTASLVAEVDGEIVGFCSLEFRERLNRLNDEAWVPDLIVRQAGRSRGVGRALLERAYELARERGCWQLTLESGAWRTDAHRFYTDRAGMDNAGFFFTRSLAD
jgi:GNAT superfamily N-acetyltransferase